MRKITLGLLFVILFSPIFGWSGFIEIVNRTDFTIYWIYVSHESESDWGDDRLGSGVLLNDEGFSIFLEDYPSAIFDVRVIDEDNDSYTFNSLDLQDRFVLEVVLDDLDRRR